jgi:hypothetical protein
LIVSCFATGVLADGAFAAATATGSTNSEIWMTTGSAIADLAQSNPADANRYFDNSRDFSIGPVPDGLATTRIVSFTSYAAFSTAVASGTIPSGVSWVQYDNEDWSQTPLQEKQEPALYMRLFAQLAHRVGYKVLETPSLDLMLVEGAPCNSATTDLSPADAYIACGLARDAQYADMFEIQSQSLEPQPSQMVALVQDAAAQAHAANSSAIVLAGLTTCRGYTASQVVASWVKLHSTVSGFWLNMPSGDSTAATAALSTIEQLDASSPDPSGTGR